MRSAAVKRGIDSIAQRIGLLRGERALEIATLTVWSLPTSMITGEVGDVIWNCEQSIP